MEKVIETKQKIKTKINIVVGLTFGMICAFFIGVNILFFMDSVFKSIR